MPAAYAYTPVATDRCALEPSIVICIFSGDGDMKEDVSPLGLAESSREITRVEILLDLTQALLREVVALHGNEICGPKVIDLAKEIESYEADLIRGALMQTGGRQTQAARLLNVKASTLHAKIKRYRILDKTPIVL